MSGRCLIDGLVTDQLPADDRGLAYGDGLFETLWVEAGVPRLWHWHWLRLTEGCTRLGLGLPSEALLLDEIRKVAEGLPQAAVRFSLTRGSGPRGYAPPQAPCERRILSASAPPRWPAEVYTDGMHLHCCEMRWAMQPRLAGLKHLNRLEQVLARSEWSDPAMGEGLMLDTDGRVISATAANLFAVVDGRCLTPDLRRCGVAGVARAFLLSQFVDIEVVDLSLDALGRASELCLSSSLRGVWPVAGVGGRRLWPGAWTRRLQAAWQAMAAAHLPPGVTVV
ncbi:aminodeoxychorismate lyase [Frateuria aurantia]